MEHHASDEDMADMLHHRATLPAVIWALLFVATCVASLFDSKPATQAAWQFTPATACASQGRPAQQQDAFAQPHQVAWRAPQPLIRHPC
jgi:hypothetical protein